MFIGVYIRGKLLDESAPVKRGRSPRKAHKPTADHEVENNMSKIYKYFPADVLPLVAQKEGFFSLKCSLPKEYNDPYELFLSVDLSAQKELLATYKEIIEELPQFPTTCFSKSPIVSPMWAHYACNHSGFVLEFDLEQLKAHFGNARFNEIVYRDAPDPSLLKYLQMAAFRCKPRDALFLTRAVFKEGYFSKYSEWGYEREFRLVAQPDDIIDVSGVKILEVPKDCVTALIVGPHFPENFGHLVKELCQREELIAYQLKIGKSLPKPFLVGTDGAAYIFADEVITKIEQLCDTCSEPLISTTKLCTWCSIDENTATEAAQRNPFNILDQIGALESYIKNSP